MDVEYFANLLINGVLVGSIYSMVALGFVLIYKATQVVNFAQGELLMIGAYICLEIIVRAQLPFIPAFLTTLVFMSLLALLIERCVLRRMRGAPVMSIVMATVGIGIVLRAVALLVWKPMPRQFPSPLPEAPVQIGGLAVAQVYLYSFALCVIFMVLFGVFFQFSRWGLVMRATASSAKAAESVGVPLSRVFAMAWVISAIVSATGGVLVANFAGLTPAQLSGYGVKVFPAVVLGGLDSIIGATVAGVVVGVLENLGGAYLRDWTGLSGLGTVAPFLVLIIILWIRPQGLFGSREVERI